MISRARLVRDLQRLGLEPGSIVLVHSSLRRLGWVEGGADTVIDALLETVGTGGTVMAPTLTGSERFGPDHPPDFDPASSPSWTGIIPETLRRRSDSRRSRHPTHSLAAIGPDAASLIEGHENCESPCAAASPYGRLAQRDGLIVLLGVSHQSNTSLHMLEEVAGVPYHLQPGSTVARVRVDDGWQEVRGRLHQYGWERDFPKLEPLLSAGGAQRNGMVGEAQSRLVQAGALLRLLLPILKQDPLYLLSESAQVRFRSERSQANL